MIDGQRKKIIIDTEKTPRMWVVYDTNVNMSK